jgi:DNA polymerase
MLTRDDVFDELGIGPVWRLRDAAPAPTSKENHAAASRAQTVATLAEPKLSEPTQNATRSLPVPPAVPELSYGSIQAETAPLCVQTPATATPTVAPPATPVYADWQTLESAVKHCTACPLHTSRTQGVLGVGDRHADWLIVGEAPGADEDAQGEPFVGQAGKLLDAMLAAIDLKRGENVYIANVLKSRPPGNRNPEPFEVAACRPYLDAQIALIQPKILLALGKFAAQTLLDTDIPVGKLRGRVHDFHGVPLVVTYHPAYLLRNLPEKARAWEDLCLARRALKGKA